jgi:quinol monooxygenase YgiN
MLIILVTVHVKPDMVNDFIEATKDNAANSRKEPGVGGFEVIQNIEDPSRFVLIEVYRSNEGPARHKDTPHYQKWRDAVAPMMAEPRTSSRFSEIPNVLEPKTHEI